MTHVEHLSEFLTSTIISLDHIRVNGAKRELTYSINCTDLEDYNLIDIRLSERFKPMFDELKEVTGPCLYWFELVSDTNATEIVSALNGYKVGIRPKATPALKSNINYSSKILYVGKVKRTFWGRLIQHLGFFKVGATQGLQLFYWGKELNLELKLNIIEFEENMIDVMPIIEYAFAKKLQPLIGKHQ
jgi:hypothetical protein